MAVRQGGHSAGYPEKPAISLFLKILLLFFLTGGLGALAGTKLIMLINGGACLQGWKAGAVFLLVSALMAVPGIFLPRLSGGGAAARLDLEPQGEGEPTEMS